MPSCLKISRGLCVHQILGSRYFWEAFVWKGMKIQQADRLELTWVNDLNRVANC